MRWTLPWLLLLTCALVLGGCPEDDDDAADDDDATGDDDTGDDDTTSDDDTGDDDTGDDDTTSDDDSADDDTGDDDTAPTGTGLMGRIGTATVDGPDYTGSEDLYLVAQKGAGDDVCRVRYDLGSTAVRNDCADCDWAFDLVASNAAVVAWEHPDCGTLLGIGSDDVSVLDGTAISYGYIDEYFGHASVITGYTNGTWAVLGFASYDPVSGAFSYDLEDGYVEY